MRLGYRVRQRLRLLVIAGLVAPAAMVVVGLAIAHLWGGGAPDLTPVPAPRTLGLGALTAGATMGLVVLLYKSSKSFERALRRSSVKVGAEALELAGYPVMIVIVTTAAIGEEVLFRGGLQPVVGLVPAALLFGFSHGGWRREMWAYTVAASLSGTIFGLMYEWTGDLWVPVTAHAVHNLLSTLLIGRKVEVEWQGGLPRIRFVPEPLDEENEERPASSDGEGVWPEEAEGLLSPPGEAMDSGEQQASSGGLTGAASDGPVPGGEPEFGASAPRGVEDAAPMADHASQRVEEGRTDGGEDERPPDEGAGDESAEPVGEPLPAETDGEAAGPDDRDSPDRPKE